MTPLRTILTFVLIAWLPLNCCCRLQAMLGMLDDHSHPACHHVCAKHAEGDDCPPQHHHDNKDHDHDCGCGGHETMAVRTAVSLLDHLAVQPLIIDLAALQAVEIRPVTPAASYCWRDEARFRVKAGGSLLRRHCALTV